MPRPASPILTNFTAGELTPRLDGRVDLDKYFNGCRSLQNMVTLPHGGARRRGGSRFIAAVKDHDRKVRLVPMQFSVTQAYVLEFGHLSLRVYTDQGLVLSGGAVYEIATPYTETDLPGLAYAQSADTLYLAHPGHAPRKLTRTAHDAWTLTTIAFTGTPAHWSSGDYPGAVAFYEQRLWWAGSPSQPQRLWASKSGDYETLTTGSADDDGLNYVIASDQVNAIRWLSPGKVLAIGTAGGEFVASGSGSEEAITPSSVRIVRQTTYGSAPVRPVRIGNVVLYVQRQGRRLRELAYRFEDDGYFSPDLTLLAEHITRGGLVELAYQQNPDSTLWAVRGDGVLLGMTYEREQEVVAWHRHVLGGDYQGGAPVVESIAAIPGDDHDELWCVVKRTINGETRRTVELISAGLETEDAQEDAFFVDSGLTYAGEPAGVVSGLDHLEGQTVAILADGAVQPSRSVVGGQVALDASAHTVHVGLPYTWLLSPMRLEVGGPTGTAQGRPKRITGLTVRLYRSLGIRVGPDADRLDEVVFRNVGEPMGRPPPLFTGDAEIGFNDGWGADGILVLSGDQPLPVTVTALMPQVRISG